MFLGCEKYPNLGVTVLNYMITTFQRALDISENTGKGLLDSKRYCHKFAYIL